MVSMVARPRRTSIVGEAGTVGLQFTGMEVPGARPTKLAIRDVRAFPVGRDVFIVYFCGLAFDRKNHGVTLRVGLAHSKHKVAVRHIGGHPKVDLIQTDGARS